LRDAHGVDIRILPLHTMPSERSRYDRHSMRLFISERVPVADRAFLAARQLVLLSEADLLDRLTGGTGLDDAEAARLCRLAFAGRLADAVLVPADRLGQAARDLRYDVGRIADRFSVRRSLVMARLCALGASAGNAGDDMPAMFLAAVDATGAVLNRIPGTGFAFPRYGSLCGRLPLFDGLRPGEVKAAPVVLPDGALFTIVATAEEGLAANDSGPPPVTYTMIGMDEAVARQTVYGGEQQGGRGGEPRPAGLTCRLCERPACPHRSHPPATRPAAFREFVVGLSDHELA
jgi:predicted transcriptional regulator